MFERFFKKNTETNSGVIEPEPDRKNELLTEIKDLDGALQNNEATMRAFRVEHTAVINGHGVLLYARGGDPGLARTRIEARWKILCAERERIQAARNAVLSELGKCS